MTIHDILKDAKALLHEKLQTRHGVYTVAQVTRNSVVLMGKTILHLDFEGLSVQVSEEEEEEGEEEGFKGSGYDDTSVEIDALASFRYVRAVLQTSPTLRIGLIALINKYGTGGDGEGNRTYAATEKLDTSAIPAANMSDKLKAYVKTLSALGPKLDGRIAKLESGIKKWAKKVTSAKDGKAKRQANFVLQGQRRALGWHIAAKKAQG